VRDFRNWTFISVSGMIKPFWEPPGLSFNLSAFNLNKRKGLRNKSPGYVAGKILHKVKKTGVEAK
jgi:hypothetical protein